MLDCIDQSTRPRRNQTPRAAEFQRAASGKRDRNFAASGAGLHPHTSAPDLKQRPASQTNNAQRRIKKQMAIFLGNYDCRRNVFLRNESHASMAHEITPIYSPIFTPIFSFAAARSHRMDFRMRSFSDESCGTAVRPTEQDAEMSSCGTAVRPTEQETIRYRQYTAIVIGHQVHLQEDARNEANASSGAVSNARPKTVHGNSLLPSVSWSAETDRWESTSNVTGAGG